MVVPAVTNPLSGWLGLSERVPQNAPVIMFAAKITIEKCPP
jgi:hypothetical protein